MKKIILVTAILFSFMNAICQNNFEIIESDPVSDIDGNTYKTIKIGNQIWMVENLKTTHYADGGSVEYFTYNNKESNVDLYGRLYSSFAVSKEVGRINNNVQIQGIAPDGWHIPSKTEWEELANYLGGLEIAGGKLKSNNSELWNKPNLKASNESKFNALPAGMHDFTNIFQWIGKTACFSSSTKTERGQVYFYIENSSEELKIGHFHPDDAVSVRCIKD